MDDLAQLELFDLVEKVAIEIKNHLGVYDKILAEFVIAQRVQKKDFNAFKQAIIEIGGTTSTPTLIDSIDRLTRNMHPSMKTKETTAQDETRKVHSNKRNLDSQKDRMVVDDSKYSKARDDDISRLRSPGARLHEDYDERSSERNISKHSRSERNEYYQRSNQRNRGHRESNWATDRGHEGLKRGRQATRYIDDTPLLHKVYDAQVVKLKEFGAFVNINGVKHKTNGLVHISRMTSNRIDHPSSLLKTGQSVKVKMIGIDGARISLSMQEIDQTTGRDFSSACFRSEANGKHLEEARERSSHGPLLETKPGSPKRLRMSSPERWEIQQLIASGAVKASDYPNLRECSDIEFLPSGETKLEEDIDVEVKAEEPPFLAGQTKLSLELSPIRIVKAPEGSLNRSAMTGTALAKERKELKQLEDTDAAKFKASLNLTAKWNDPLPPQGIEEIIESHGPSPNSTKYAEIPEWKRAIIPKEQSDGKRTNTSMKEKREALPVFAFRSEIIEAVRKNQILIILGETGSGKTTQTTQYLAEAGFTNNGIIACTQPRRVAAISVAKRVSEEVGCTLGEAVGYSIRFDECTSSATKIKYMTDGMLQREILQDPRLERYSVVMLDEAHERTIATDVLFALLKKTLTKRPDLKIIVTSATLNAERFSCYFNNAPILSIPGRTFPVEVLYSREPESDYLDAALLTVMQIHLTEPAGDILLFLTGQDEIDTACEILYERTKALGASVPELLILPVYSALPTEIQTRIFEPSCSRKVIIATNIAETSITIDNIYYVVDPGFVKQKAYDPKLGMDSLVITPISQAQANQRAGRAGRTGPGKCFRLYTEVAFQSEMLPSTIPDIQRQNLATTILMLKAMGINDLLRFDFMDPPPVNAILTTLEELYALRALDEEGFLTTEGRRMAHFPMEPPLSKVLLTSVELGCSNEMITIVAMLNLSNVFYRPKQKQAIADRKKSNFHDSHGDHLTLLNIYSSWKQSNYSNAWCAENFIHARSMKQAKNMREQLLKILERYNLPIISCDGKTEKVRRALCAGFFRNTARREKHAGAGAGSFKTLVEGTPVYLHPSSALSGRSSEWVIYHVLVLTTKEYMHWVTSIEPKWLVESAPTFFKVTGTNGTMSKRRQRERIEPFHIKGIDRINWRLSAQSKRGSCGRRTWG